MEIIKQIIAQLEGKKTYIVAFIVATLNLLAAFGVISPEDIKEINTVLAALGLAALRAGVDKK